jgi:hypothetical protein
MKKTTASKETQTTYFKYFVVISKFDISNNPIPLLKNFPWNKILNCVTTLSNLISYVRTLAIKI